MDLLNAQQLHGISPALDLIAVAESSGQQQEEGDAAYSILQVEESVQAESVQANLWECILSTQLKTTLVVPLPV